MRLSLRYDMRAPAIGAPAEVLYAASLDQCAWADKLGFDTVYLAEHHGADDGYCASPMIQAAAIAARTSAMRIHLSALLPVMHNPLRLAEDFATADILTGGRTVFGVGRGYHTREVESLGGPMLDQNANREVFEEGVEIIFKAFNNESFSHKGAHYTLPPHVPYRGYELKELTLVP